MCVNEGAGSKQVKISMNNTTTGINIIFDK